MSEDSQPAAAEPPADGPSPSAPGSAEQPAPGGEPGAQGEAEQPPAERDPFARVGHGAMGGAGSSGGSGTAQAARANFVPRTAERVVYVRGDNQYNQGNVYITQLAGGGGSMVAGPVPAEELVRLAAVYREAPGYPQMKRQLRRCGLLALCGEPGSGRTATALALLAELTEDEVVRLDPGTPLHQISASEIEEKHGYLLELPDEEWYQHPGPEEREGRSERATLQPPAQLHLDRLSALFTAAGAYGVLVVASGERAAQLLRGRYGMHCVPPPWEEVLDRQLRMLLTEAPDGAREEALNRARQPDVQEALGLDELRPGEAAQLARLLARHHSGELTDEQLLDSCATFVVAQAREWFAGADRPGTMPAALPAVSTAAFRIAVAVFNGSAYGVTAVAGDRLAHWMALALDPEQAPGRRLFAVHAEDRFGLARSVLADGELDLGETQVPVQVVRFQGRRLATAVLHEVWQGYHSLRGPLAHWLRELCQDPRPELWIRSSIAVGVLCSWDWGDGFATLVLPMADSDEHLLRMSAAIALAEASREPSVQPAVRSLLRQWARGEGHNRRMTAALCHGYGMAAGSVTASLDELGRLVRRQKDESSAPEGDWDRYVDVLGAVGYSVTRLLAGTEPETVLRRLGDWVRAGHRAHTDTVLVTVLDALWVRTTFLWGLNDVPALEPYSSRLLVSGWLSAEPRLASQLADLVSYALVTPRVGQSTLAALAGWMRQAVEDEEQLRVLCGFLPLLGRDRRDRDRLRHLLARLVRDVDEPLDKAAARQMWDAVEGAE